MEYNNYLLGDQFGNLGILLKLIHIMLNTNIAEIKFIFLHWYKDVLVIGGMEPCKTTLTTNNYNM